MFTQFKLCCNQNHFLSLPCPRHVFGLPVTAELLLYRDRTDDAVNSSFAHHSCIKQYALDISTDHRISREHTGRRCCTIAVFPLAIINFLKRLTSTTHLRRQPASRPFVVVASLVDSFIPCGFGLRVVALHREFEAKATQLQQQ